VIEQVELFVPWITNNVFMKFRKVCGDVLNDSFPQTCLVWFFIRLVVGFYSRIVCIL